MFDRLPALFFSLGIKNKMNPKVLTWTCMNDTVLSFTFCSSVLQQEDKKKMLFHQ